MREGRPGNQVDASLLECLFSQPTGKKGFQAVSLGFSGFNGRITETAQLDKLEILNHSRSECINRFDQGSGFGHSGAEKNGQPGLSRSRTASAAPPCVATLAFWFFHDAAPENSKRPWSMTTAF